MDEQPFLDALEKVPQAESRMLDGFEKGPLKIVRGYVGDSPFVWLENEGEPWAFMSESQLPFRSIQVKEPERAQRVLSVLPGVSVPLERAYLSVLADHDGMRRGKAELANLRAARQSTEEETGRLQQMIEQAYSGIRRVLTAWVLAVRDHHSLSKWPPKDDQLQSFREKYRGQTHANRFWHDAGTQPDDFEAAYRSRLQRLNEQAPPWGLLVGEVSALWEIEANPLIYAPDRFRIALSVLGEELDVPYALTGASCAGVLVYASRAAKHISKLAWLAPKVWAYDFLRRRVIHDREIPEAKGMQDFLAEQESPSSTEEPLSPRNAERQQREGGESRVTHSRVDKSANNLVEDRLTMPIRG